MEEQSVSNGSIEDDRHPGVQIEEQKLAAEVYPFGDPGRDPRTRVITVVYFALLDAERLPMKVPDDVADVAWFPVYELPLLAFDHSQILAYTLNRLRGKLDYTTIAFNLLPE